MQYSQAEGPLLPSLDAQLAALPKQETHWTCPSHNLWPHPTGLSPSDRYECCADLRSLKHGSLGGSCLGLGWVLSFVALVQGWHSYWPCEVSWCHSRRVIWPVSLTPRGPKLLSLFLQRGWLTSSNLDQWCIPSGRARVRDSGQD